MISQILLIFPIFLYFGAALDVDSLSARNPPPLPRGFADPLVVPVSRADGEYRVNITLNRKPLSIRIETAEPNLWVPMRHCQTIKEFTPDPCSAENSYDLRESQHRGRRDWLSRPWRPTEWEQANGDRLDVADQREEEIGLTSVTGRTFSTVTQLHLVSRVPRSTGAFGLDPESHWLRHFINQFRIPAFTLALTQKHGRLVLGSVNWQLCDTPKMIWVDLAVDCGWWLKVDELSFGKLQRSREVSLKGQSFQIGSHSDELVLPKATIEALIRRGLVQRSPDGKSLVGNSALDAWVDVRKQRVQIRGRRLSTPLLNNPLYYRYRIRAQRNSSEPLILGLPFLESNCLIGELKRSAMRMGVAQQRNNWD